MSTIRFDRAIALASPDRSGADPDGYIWNIGYSAQGKDQPYAE